MIDNPKNAKHKCRIIIYPLQDLKIIPRKFEDYQVKKKIHKNDLRYKHIKKPSRIQPTKESIRQHAKPVSIKSCQ